jgi:hypothetical protein
MALFCPSVHFLLAIGLGSWQYDSQERVAPRIAKLGMSENWNGQILNG